VFKQLPWIAWFLLLAAVVLYVVTSAITGIALLLREFSWCGNHYGSGPMIMSSDVVRTSCDASGVAVADVPA
jgi:hypothetical protein